MLAEPVSISPVLAAAISRNSLREDFGMAQLRFFRVTAIEDGTGYVIKTGAIRSALREKGYLQDALFRGKQSHPGITA